MKQSNDARPSVKANFKVPQDIDLARRYSTLTPFTNNLHSQNLDSNFMRNLLLTQRNLADGYSHDRLGSINQSIPILKLKLRTSMPGDSASRPDDGSPYL